MIFKILAKSQLPKLFELLSENIIVGPTTKAEGVKGKPLYSFEVIKEFSDLELDYTSTRISAKKYFLPYAEQLCTFEIGESKWSKSVDYNVNEPIVFFGMHACDINAMNKLDKVLLGSRYPTPYYASKRKNMFIVGIGCDPQPYCFCKDMGTDTAQTGFDMFLHETDGHYFVEILSVEAFNYLSLVETRELDEDDHEQFMAMVKERNKKFIRQVDTTDLTKILDMEFQADVWKHWGDKCMSCGTCANTCPTCYCYGVEENVGLDLKSANKMKYLHSCNLIDFAEVAGGHNFRPESHIRLKYRYYHKHRGFVEAFEESLCVGCGRCGEACLANITVPEVIASVRGEED